MNINEYFGTLLQSVTEAHKKHLMTGKYSDHKALNEFYDEMPELVDALIEHYQGENGKVENLKNVIEAEGKDAVAYEKSDSEAAKTYVNVLVVKEGNEENEGIQALADVLKSDAIKEYINNTYDGAVVPFE